MSVYRRATCNRPGCPFTCRGVGISDEDAKRDAEKQHKRAWPACEGKLNFPDELKDDLSQSQGEF